MWIQANNDDIFFNDIFVYSSVTHRPVRGTFMVHQDSVYGPREVYLIQSVIFGPQKWILSFMVREVKKFGNHWSKIWIAIETS